MAQQVNLGHVVGPGIHSGGTTGQILKKASGTNFDTAWMDALQLPEVTGLASDLAGEFNASTVYQEGDFCTNGAILYKRNSWGGSTPAAEAWDATHWTAVNVTDEIQADRTAIAGEASTRAAADTALGTDVANLRSDLGIVENTNTATHTIAAGQYVIWKGLLYTASSAIPSGTTLSTSNLTAVSGGGLNSLNGNIVNKYDKFDMSSVSGATTPLATIQGNWSNIPTEAVAGRIPTSNGNWTYTGRKTNSTYGSFVCNSYVSNSIQHIINYNGTWSVHEVALKDLSMFNKISDTFTTSSLGNATLSSLAATNVIIAVKPPMGVGVGFTGRGSNGTYYAHIVDSSGNALANTSVALDIYYL